MSSVGAGVLKVVDKMADIFVAGVTFVGITEVPQNLSFEDVLVGAVALGAQHLQSVVVGHFPAFGRRKVSMKPVSLSEHDHEARNDNGNENGVNLP